MKTMYYVLMINALIFLVFGLIFVVKGADWLVEGSSAVARRLGVSELAIGLTIVAFGTSMPELTVNLFSSFRGASDIAIGNIVGSNIANILLILGIVGILSPMRIQTSTVWKEIPFALLATCLVLVMTNDAILDSSAISVLSRSDGLSLIGFFFIFLWYIVGMKGELQMDDKAVAQPILRSVGMIFIGLTALIIGGKLVVDGATNIALFFGISQALIGFTIVAVGTSVPEFATSVVAARKGKADIAVGNIVGSNIFNIFWILGISAVIRPIPFAPAFNADVLIMIGATMILFFAVHRGHIHRRLLFWKQREDHIVERADGWIMFSGYLAYLCFLIWRG
jgi:cation:H+ antiporter